MNKNIKMMERNQANTILYHVFKYIYYVMLALYIILLL